MGNPHLRKIDTEEAKRIGAIGGSNKKGSKHIATHIREMLEDENFELKLKDGSILKGRPIHAIIKTAIAKAMSGDMRAFDMLAKYGYGMKLDITSGGNPIVVNIGEEYANKPRFRIENNAIIDEVAESGSQITS